jgi:hypothetical protein
MGKAKKDQHPVERDKLAAAQEVIRRAVEGGLLEGIKLRSGRDWGRVQHEASREVARRFRGLLAKDGVRVFCEPQKAATNGITLSIDVPGADGDLAGYLWCSPTYGSARFVEG